MRHSTDNLLSVSASQPATDSLNCLGLLSSAPSVSGVVPLLQQPQTLGISDGVKSQLESLSPFSNSLPSAAPVQVARVRLAPSPHLAYCLLLLAEHHRTATSNGVLPYSAGTCTPLSADCSFPALMPCCAPLRTVSSDSVVVC